MAESVIIRSPNHLGDCIMALPMVNEAREVHPGAQITLLVPENLKDIFTNNPAIDEIITVPSNYVHGLVAVTKIKDILNGKKYDIGYILPPSFGAAAGLKLAGVKERIGYIADGRRLLLTKPLPLPTPINSEHRSVLYFNLLRRSTSQEIEYVKPKIFLNDDDVEQAVSLLSEFGREADKPFVTIAFQAKAESRRWGVENYTELIKKIKMNLGSDIVLVGGEEDLKIGDEIVNDVGKKGIYNLAGKTTIRETAAVMSLSKLFIGNDSGPAHLAAAVGVPVIVLSGADDPKSTSPQAIDKALIYQDELECISCVKNKCPLKNDDFMKCMRSISIDQVFQAVELIY